MIVDFHLLSLLLYLLLFGWVMVISNTQYAKETFAFTLVQRLQPQALASIQHILKINRIPYIPAWLYDSVRSCTFLKIVQHKNFVTPLKRCNHGAVRQLYVFENRTAQRLFYPVIPLQPQGCTTAVRFYAACRNKHEKTHQKVII